MASKQIDLLHGTIGDKLLAFVVPLAATSILQQLFNAADVAVVGQFCGTEAMAAVGGTSAFIGLMVSFVTGISLGANVVLANFIGSDNRDGIKRTVSTAIIMGFVLGLIFTALGEFTAVPVTHALGVPDEIFDGALLYLKIYMGGMPFIVLYNFEASIFRSIGDTRTPLIMLTVSGFINVIMNLIFVLGMGMDVDGVATATVLSNLISSVALLVVLIKRRSAVRLEPRHMTFSSRAFFRIIEIGLPAGLQAAMFTFANVIIQSAINSLGSDVMAASSAAFNLEILDFYVVSAYSQAMTTFIGQNYGAGSPERCKRIFRICMLQAYAAIILVSVLLCVFAGPLLSLFTDSEEVISIGIIRLYFIAGFEVVNAVTELLSGWLRGFGISLMPAVLCFFGICVVRIIWVYTLFRAHPTFEVIMACYPGSWACASVLLIVAAVWTRRKTLAGFFAAGE